MVKFSYSFAVAGSELISSVSGLGLFDRHQVSILYCNCNMVIAVPWALSDRHVPSYFYGIHTSSP